MNVALDGTPLTAGPGGIARYTAELHRALQQCFPEDSFRLVSDQLNPPKNWLDRRWWTFGIQKAIRDADLFHGTDFAVPYLPLKPAVMTLHDLSPWNGTDASSRVRTRTPYLIGLGLATMVITPSEAVRRAAIDFFRIPPARIVAIPLAAAPHLCPVGTVPGNYFLFVGTIEPRKNVETLIAAWREVRKHCAVDLILAGRRRENLAEEPGLRLLGEVPEQDLAALYSGAIACLYPSLYEGFGLPVLEAMQCGAAVIASRDPAIAETAGQNAVLVDATDTRGWIHAMLQAVQHPEWLLELRARSLARAAEFSWQRTARSTYAVYQEARSRFG